jgi:hypothetical protein
MSDQTRPTDRPTTDPTRAALEALVKWSKDPKSSPNIFGCDCRKPDETWDDVDEDAPLVLCAMHERRWGSVQRDTAVMVLMDLEAALHEVWRLIADIPLAALAAEPRGSSGVVEQSATQRKHEYHSERTDFDFWCIASCHDDGRCDGECDPDCESCPIPCPLCEAAAPTPPPADESAERHEWEGMASYPECSCGWRGHAGSHDYGVSQHKEHVAAARKEGHRE